VLSIISLAGIPLTMGFIGKFYLLNQAVISESWWLISGLVIGSGIGLAYYLPLIFTMFKNTEDNQLKNEVSKGIVVNSPQLFITFLIIISVYFGIFPDTLSQYMM